MPTVLIVDDSSVIRQVCTVVLGELGFKTLEAEDGQHALELCMTAMPDIILVDWQMPLLNGVEFIKALRGYEGGETPHIIFLTSEFDIGQIAMSRKEGSNDHMMKPLDRKILNEKFQPLLATYSS